MKIYKGVILLIFSLLLQSFATIPTYATGNDTGSKNAAIVYLNKAEDLMNLSKICSREDFTIGKTFVLKNDISLKDMDYIPISVFSGTFEGNGHKISGFELKDSGTDIGLFRFIGTKGIISNLQVEGTVSYQNDGIIIGGIAGTNKGIINNCSFTGSMIAGSSLGGIVGVNEKTGVISNCRNFAVITGTKKTGGIVGDNKGTIEGSVNNGKINASSKKVNKKELDAEQNINITEMLEDEDKVESIGGIAGASSGILSNSINKGIVGFDHIGYQVGGIVGYQCGYILSCYNEGTVRGRDYVAGIAGIFEPYVEVNYKEDALMKVSGQLDTLDDKVDSLSDSIDDADDKLENNTDILDNHMENFSDKIDYYDDYFKEKDKKIDKEIKNRSDKADNSVDKIDFNVDTDKFLKNINELNNEIIALENIVNYLEMAGDTQTVEAVEQLNEELGTIVSSNIQDASENSETTTAEATVSENVVAEATVSENAAAEDADTEDADTEEANTESANTENADTDSGDINIEGSNELLIVLGRIRNTLGSMAQFPIDIVDETDEQIDNIEDAYNDTDNLITYIWNELDSYNDDLDNAGDDLGESVDNISDQIDKTDDDFKESEKKIDEQIDLVDEQLTSIKNTVQDGIDRFEKRLEDEDLFDDISDTEDESETSGKIIRCENTGEIIADMNCGGIAGKIALDINNIEDMEVKENGKESLNYDQNLTACILKCINYSDIIIKNDYVGGIIGCADYGAMILCENYGNIESEDGKYVGGIAGRSDYMIRNSYSICNVKSEEYAGGIVGYGNKILNNTAMAAAFCSNDGKAGTIAGDADSEGKISNNIFVFEEQGAVNNVTYLDEANAVEYSQLILNEELPKGFQNFHIKYIANGKVLKKMTCKYGEKIAQVTIPEIPEKDGYNGVWEEADVNFVNRNLTIKAVYEGWQTTISTKANIGEKPIAMASADFYPETQIECSNITVNNDKVPKGYLLKNAYQYHIITPEKKEWSQLELRILTDKIEGAVVAVYDKNVYKIVEIEKIGSYSKIYVSSPEGTVLILQKHKMNIIWLIAFPIVLIIIGGCLYFLRKKHIVKLLK